MTLIYSAIFQSHCALSSPCVDYFSISSADIRSIGSPLIVARLEPGICETLESSVACYCIVLYRMLSMLIMRVICFVGLRLHPKTSDA